MSYIITPPFLQLFLKCYWLRQKVCILIVFISLQLRGFEVIERGRLGELYYLDHSLLLRDDMMELLFLCFVCSYACLKPFEVVCVVLSCCLVVGSCICLWLCTSQPVPLTRSVDGRNVLILNPDASWGVLEGFMDCHCLYHHRSCFCCVLVPIKYVCIVCI